jgi:4-hydroxybenzoate polyprenyltransferase
MPFAMIGFFLGLYTVRAGSDSGIVEGLGLKFGTWDSILQVGFKLLLVILCMIFARSAAMAFNRYLDRHFDTKNPRTAIREIPRGIISASNVLRFVVVCCMLFMVCCYFINRICFFLSPIALFVVLFYSYTKRFTPFCHLVLGLGLSLAPIGAYLAVRGAFALLPVLFSLTVIFWVSGFDIIYALQDEDFDKAEELYSMPSRLGKSGALRVSELLHLLSFVCVAVAGAAWHFGPWYWIGAVLFTGMLFYQHSIVKPNDLSRVNIAFMTANGVASVVFALFVIADLVFH